MTTLILFGAINYFLFGIISSLRIRKDTLHNLYFALFMFSIASIMIRVAYFRGIGSYNDWIWLLPILSFAIAPAFYLYVQALSQQSTNKPFIHFIPVALHIVYQIVMKYFNHLQPSLVPSHDILNIIGYVFGVLLFAQILYYIIKTQYLIRKNIIAIKEHYSNLEGKQLKWIKILFIFLITIVFSWVLTRFTSWAIQIPIKSLPFVFIGIWLLSYYLFAIWLTQKQIKIPNTTRPEKQNETSDDLKENNNLMPLWKRVNNEMLAKEYFLDEGMNLQKLATILEVPARHLSECINLHGEVNFHVYVNSFRVERVKEEMVNEKNNHLTILGIAFKAGFKSKSSFNQVFKDSTGFTPKQFILNKR